MSEVLRRDAVTCALAGIAAVDPGDLVTAAIAQQHISGGVTLFAAGKGAIPMAHAAITALAGTVRRGIVIAPAEPFTRHARLEYFVGGHPFPDEAGMQGARTLLRALQDLHPGDTLVCLISGGASSLMTLPADGLDISDLVLATTLLMRAGATIEELNCVRKHLDRLKGGRLAALAFPSPVIALVLSDVVGDSLATIASGPTTADPTTIADAVSVLRDRGVWDRVPATIREHLMRGNDESPKPGDPRLALATNRIIGSNVTAAAAASDQARSLGYESRIVTTSLTGEAREVGADIGRQLRDASGRESSRPLALIFAGETTVTVQGRGSGGRNQELAIGAAIALDGARGVAVASLGTDGVDGPTDAAGAVADGESMQRARHLGLDASAILARNDSHTFWKALGALVRTGPTGTNVMDIVVALAAPARA